MTLPSSSAATSTRPGAEPIFPNAAAAATPGRPPLRLFQPENPATALGLAVSHLMTKPAFANLRFGDWSRILVGQINRGHYRLVIDGNNEMQGFIGWALTSREKAEAWVEGRRGLTYDESLHGDCVVINAWSANSNKVNRFIVTQARTMLGAYKALYFKRHYPDGSTRPMRMNVNDFVEGHD